jgi:hypothetical protein
MFYLADRTQLAFSATTPSARPLAVIVNQHSSQMDDYDKIILGFQFSIIGIALGWLLNQLAQWFRTRQEDKKNLKRVLYNLLEILDVFMRLDYEKTLNQAVEKVMLKIPEHERNEMNKKVLHEFYSKLLNEMIVPQIIKEFNATHSNYVESIKLLSSIDPILAFNLNGKRNIYEGFELLENSFRNLELELGNDNSSEETADVLNIIKPDIVIETIGEIESDIKKVSWGINPFVWYKSKRKIKAIKRDRTQEFGESIDSFFEKIPDNYR